MFNHSTPKPYTSTAVLGTERETGSGVISGRPSDFPLSLREDSRVKEIYGYNGARPKVKISTPYMVITEPELQNQKRNPQYRLLNEGKESIPIR